MEKSQLFMTAIVAMIIFLGVVLSFAVAENIKAEMTGWSRAAGDGGLPGYNFFVGANDTIYLAEGKTIHAISQDGTEKWGIVPPDPEHISEYGTHWNLQAAAARDGRVYMVIQPSDGQVPFYRGELLAISEDGTTLWNHVLNISEPDMRTDAKLYATANRLYLFNDGMYQVYNPDGKLLWSITDIDYLPSLDEEGYVYTAIGPYGAKNEYPSNLKAYYPNGTIYWSHYTADYNLTNLAGSLGQMPIYRNGLLYLWLEDGVAAVARNGSMLWTRDYPESLYDIDLYYLDGDSPFDQSGNIYLIESIYDTGSPGGRESNPGDNLKERRVHVISPDGAEKTFDLPLDFRLAPAHSISNGIAYSAEPVPVTVENLSELNPYRLTAYDVLTGGELWSFTASASPKQTILTNGSTISAILNYDDARKVIDDNKLPPQAWYKKYKKPYGSMNISSGSSSSVLAGQNNIYLSYLTYNYEYPAFIGKSNCTYAGGIYAIGRDGRLVWSKPLDSYVTSTVEKNGTVYYRMSDGKFSAARTGLAAGTIFAAAYVLLRVLGLGTVARARSRLDKNENRSCIIKLVESHPGLTLHEIARLAGINVGTVRYHLLILSLNHKISTFDDGDKFVRYFRNSKTYSDDEMLIISLARRVNVRRLMVFIADSQGLPNAEIAKQLDIPESAVSKQMRILAARDVVVKAANTGEKQAYHINDRFLPIIKSQVKVIGQYGE